MYTGRLDNASGNVTSGIAYSVLTDSTAATSENGLLPDVNYSVQSALEDSNFSRTEDITSRLKAVFIPQDYSMLNMKSPTDSTSTQVPQRLFFLIMGGPPSQIGVAKIIITQNWEAIPAISTSDYITTSYNPYPCDFNPQKIFSYIIENNLVITKDDKEYGFNSFKSDYIDKI